MNYYEILRVPTNANFMEIRRAYKDLVKKYHPDIYEGNKLFAEHKIKEINEAYEVLKEQSKKSLYDAELNFEKYQPKKEDFVKTYTRTDFDRYTNIYNKKIKNNYKEIENKKTKNWLKINIDSIIKNYFRKFDEIFETEDKQDLAIIILITLSVVFAISILKIIFL